MRALAISFWHQSLSARHVALNSCWQLVWQAVCSAVCKAAVMGRCLCVGVSICVTVAAAGSALVRKALHFVKKWLGLGVPLIRVLYQNCW
jgi:hypothetical protein